jgi:hypothetical protein
MEHEKVFKKSMPYVGTPKIEKWMAGKRAKKQTRYFLNHLEHATSTLQSFTKFPFT